MTTAFPLAWPHWVKRTTNRQPAKFSKKVDQRFGASTFKVSNYLTVADARNRLQRELELLGARSPILSSNIELRLDGQPRSGIEPNDPGVTVYFTLKGKPLCMPCDKWDRVADNIAAIAAHIDAIRRIERYGVQSVEEAFAGFAALPPPMAWWQKLGFDGPVDRPTAERAFKTLAHKYHPDKPDGDPERMKEIGSAIAEARKELAA